MTSIISVILSLFVQPVVASDNVAYYSVPVNPRLEKYALFEIEAPLVKLSQGLVTVSYKMPAELVGADFPEVTLIGTGYSQGEFQLRGEFADADCQRLAERTTCHIEFKENVEIDPIAVKEAIKESAKTIKEKKLRERVAKVFSGDPVGILSY